MARSRWSLSSGKSDRLLEDVQMESGLARGLARHSVGWNECRFETENMSKVSLGVAFIATLFCALIPTRSSGASNADLIGFVQDVGAARDVVSDPSTRLV